MNFSSSVQIGARFKLVAHKGNENNPTKETDWFNNLVLDSGLDRLSVGSAIGLVAVGSGNSTPVVTQTGLDNVVATTTSVFGNEVRFMNATTQPYYFGARRTYRFGEGAAAGNLTEVGIGWNADSMFNRTLIKDSQGNPTTLTILSDEFLDVIVEIRHYPQESFTGSFNLIDKLGNVVSNHTLNGVCIITSGNFTLGKVEAGDGSRRIYIYNGVANLDSVTSSPSGNSDYSGDRVVTYPTPRSMNAVYTLSLVTANFDITSFSIGVKAFARNSDPLYKFQIDPPIPKNNTQVMTISFTISWDRYTGS